MRQLTLADHARMVSEPSRAGISADITNQRSMVVQPDPERDQRARLVLSAFAAEQDEPEVWLVEMLDALGLR